MYRLTWNLEVSNSWNPQGLSRPVMRWLLLSVLIEGVAWSFVHRAVPSFVIVGALKTTLHFRGVNKLRSYLAHLVSPWGKYLSSVEDRLTERCIFLIGLHDVTFMRLPWNLTTFWQKTNFCIVCTLHHGVQYLLSAYDEDKVRVMCDKKWTVARVCVCVCTQTQTHTHTLYI
jgi:hypothetical protein